MIKDRWWTSAVRIENGDFIETKRGIYEEISNVEVGSLNYSQFVYNLTVDDNHTFYVGNRGYLAHNKAKVMTCKELAERNLEWANIYENKLSSKIKVEGKYRDSLSDSGILREELKLSGINPPPYPNAAHHIIPWNYSRASAARKILDKFGMELK